MRKVNYFLSVLLCINFNFAEQRSIISECIYYPQKIGWFRWNSHTNKYIPCEHEYGTHGDILNSSELGIMWPEEEQISKDQHILIISLAGSAMALKNAALVKWLVDMETDDDVGHIADNYRYLGNKAITISGAPALQITEELSNALTIATELIVGLPACDKKKSILINLLSGLPLAGETYCSIESAIEWISALNTIINVKEALDERNFRPTSSEVANKIESIVSNMSSNAKVVLVGKSMGGCILLKAAQELKDKVDIDLLVLVDASCTIMNHEYDYQNIFPNVKKVYSFYQRNYNESQNGYPINYVSNPLINQELNIDVNDVDLCHCDTLNVPIYKEFPEVGDDVIGYQYPYGYIVGLKKSFVKTTHGQIDTCTALLEEINNLITEEVSSIKSVDITPAINLLLN